MNRLIFRMLSSVLTLSLLAGCAGTRFISAPDPPLTPENALMTAEKVLLGIEHGVAEPVVARWRSSPVMFVEGAGAEDQAMLDELAGELNALIKPAGIQIRRAGKPSQANFFVYFAPRSGFYRIAEQYGFDYLNNYPGFFTVWWDRAHVIYKAVVMIDSGLSRERRRHYIYEEVTQALGLSNDQPYFRSSVFFEKKGDGGIATTLSDLDRRLIFFLYRWLKPGDGKTELRRAFEAHWQETSGMV